MLEYPEKLGLTPGNLNIVDLLDVARREITSGVSTAQRTTPETKQHAQNHTTLVFARYIMLELARRSEKGPRTLGTLFHIGCDELRQASFAEAVVLLLNSLQPLIKRFSDKIAAPVAAALMEFMTQILALFRRLMLLTA